MNTISKNQLYANYNFAFQPTNQYKRIEMLRIIKGFFVNPLKLTTSLTHANPTKTPLRYSFSQFHNKNQSGFQSQLGRFWMRFRPQKQTDTHGPSQEILTTQTQPGPFPQILTDLCDIQRLNPRHCPRYISAQTQAAHSHCRKATNQASSACTSQPIPRKAWFNYQWNYKIGNQNQKYIYLLLEDLLTQMNSHQIYDVKEMERVFGEVERVLMEDFDCLKRDVEGEVRKMMERVEFVQVKTQQREDTVSVASKILKNHADIGERGKRQEEVRERSKRNELKSKVKSQMDAKYKTTTQTQPKSQRLKQNKQPSIQQPQSIPSPNTETTHSQTPVEQPSFQLKNILSHSLSNSASFTYNMLMYYVLILENVLRYETGLIKQPEFYSLYKNAVENFVFSDRVEIMLKNLMDTGSQVKRGNYSGVSGQMYKEINKQLQKQMEFAKLIKRSVLAGGSGKSKTITTDTSIDPHKLLTYLINYRHLLSNNETQVQHPAQLQINSTQDVLINYLKLLCSQSDKGKLQESIVSTEDRMISLAANNKPFINSLKQIYLESKQIAQIKSSPDSKTANAKDNKNKLQQKLSIDCKTNMNVLKDLPTHKLVECIFERIDQWYTKQQHKPLTNSPKS